MRILEIIEKIFPSISINVICSGIEESSGVSMEEKNAIAESWTNDLLKLQLWEETITPVELSDPNYVIVPVSSYGFLIFLEI